MKELAYCSAASLARAICEGRTSATEVLRVHRDRIAEVNPALNAIVQHSAQAEDDARLADEDLRSGRLRGPLHGVPFTVKDSLETSRLITTSGSLGRRSFIPERDATAVARMRAAGAICLGKTNVPDLTLAFETDNLVYGRTNNPYDRGRTPGGSSGGEAAIIAAGGSPLGLGSDLGGSLRYPAHFCGIASLKPTSGRVPRTGHFPPAGGVLDALWHVGPLARSVEDLVLVLPLLAGPDGEDTGVVSAALNDPHQVKLKALRAAFYTDNGLRAASPEVDAAVRSVAELLSQECYAVEEKVPPGLAEAFELPWKLFAADEGEGLKALLKSIGADRLHPYLQRNLERLQGGALSPEQFRLAVNRLDQVRGLMLSFLTNIDVIVCPVHPHPAPRHGESSTDEAFLDFSYTVPYSTTGWPVVTVRAGCSPEGLPIGVQIISRPWQEHVALAVGLLIEHSMGGWRRPPM